MQYLYFSLISFLVVEFFLPVSRNNKKKTNGNRRGYLRFFFLTMVLYAFPLLVFAPFEYCWIVLPVTAIHFLLQFAKKMITKRSNTAAKLFAFVLHHILQIVVFYLFYLWIGLMDASKTAYCKLGIAGINTLFTENHLFIALVFLYVTLAGTQFMRLFLDFVYRKVPDYAKKLYLPEEGRTEISTQVTTGKIIGVLERALIFVFVASGNLTAIPFILAAKSLARFKQLNDRDFAEYYLIGTLSSVLLALCGGLLVR